MNVYIVAVIFVYFQLKLKSTKFDQKFYQTHIVSLHCNFRALERDFSDEKPYTC